MRKENMKKSLKTPQVKKNIFNNGRYFFVAKLALNFLQSWQNQVEVQKFFWNNNLINFHIFHNQKYGENEQTLWST